MNCREMHIEIDQSTQLVAANRSRKWYPEEKDWVLNKMQDQFVRSKLVPKKDASGTVTGGFELNQVGADDIRMLVVNNTKLIPYIVDAETYKCFLPADYKYLLSDGSRTILLCSDTAPVIASHTFHRTILRQERSLHAAPRYASVIVTLPDQAVSVPTDLPPFNAHAGYPELEDISFLLPWILWKANTWYWERFDELYKPGHYIHVQLTSPTTDATMEIDGVETGDDAASSWENPVASTRTYTYHTAEGVLRNNRLSGTDSIRDLRQASFFGTAYYSPITELQNSLLWVYRDKTFTVSEVDISYIRKPQPISLSLNTDCELASDTHQVICAMAVEYLQNRVKDLQGAQLSEANMIKRIIL